MPVIFREEANPRVALLARYMGWDIRTAAGCMKYLWEESQASGVTHAPKSVILIWCKEESESVGESLIQNLLKPEIHFLDQAGPDLYEIRGNQAEIAHTKANREQKRNAIKARWAKEKGHTGEDTAEDTCLDTSLPPSPSSPSSPKGKKNSYPPDDPLAKVFENLIAVPKYAAIFDAKKDRETVQAHMERSGLTLGDMEQVSWDLRCWADGPNAKGIKSPRGLFATFVKRHAERKASQPQQAKPAQPKITRLTGEESPDELY